MGENADAGDPCAGYKRQEDARERDDSIRTERRDIKSLGYDPLLQDSMPGRSGYVQLKDMSISGI